MVISKFFIFHNSKNLILVTEVRVTHYSIPKSGRMFKLSSLLATLTSAVKGDHIYTSAVEMGGLFICEKEPQCGGIQIPLKYKLYEDDSYKDIVRNILTSIL